MADKPVPPFPQSQSSASSSETKPVTGEAAALVVSHRTAGERGSDVRDAMMEMAERAQLISQEAGTKIVSAMKDVIGTAAGLAGFAVESVRDLVQFMVRRGQMTQDEADKLIREAEEAHKRRVSSPREAARREPTKGVANLSAKRMAASATVAPPERPEKAAKASKAEKPTATREDKLEKPAKRSTAKKSETRSAPPKKRR